MKPDNKDYIDTVYDYNNPEYKHNLSVLHQAWYKIYKNMPEANTWKVEVVRCNDSVIGSVNIKIDKLFNDVHESIVQYKRKSAKV